MSEAQKSQPAAERAMDNAIEFMSRKESRQEREMFLHRLLFGM